MPRRVVAIEGIHRETGQVAFVATQLDLDRIELMMETFLEETFTFPITIHFNGRRYPEHIRLYERYDLFILIEGREDVVFTGVELIHEHNMREDVPMANGIIQTTARTMSFMVDPNNIEDYRKNSTKECQELLKRRDVILGVSTIIWGEIDGHTSSN